jgi:hypothetical protein
MRESSSSHSGCSATVATECLASVAVSALTWHSIKTAGLALCICSSHGRRGRRCRNRRCGNMRLRTDRTSSPRTVVTGLSEIPGTRCGWVITRSSAMASTRNSGAFCDASGAMSGAVKRCSLKASMRTSSACARSPVAHSPSPVSGLRKTQRGLPMSIGRQVGAVLLTFPTSIRGEVGRC